MPNANMELVTSHQGTPHITVDQVKDLIAGISGDISGIKIFKGHGSELNYQIADVLQINIGSGQGLAGGYHFQLLDDFSWILDPGTMGYSRIDMLYLVIYEDTLTNVQSVDLVYEPGLVYPNGSSGSVPAAPSGTDVREAFPLYRADVKDGSILSVSGFGTSYLSNTEVLNQLNDIASDLEESVGGTVGQVQTNTNEIAQMKVTFQDGVDAVYNALVAIGITPTASTPTAIAESIAQVGSGNATAAQILSGKTAFASKALLTGTMTDRGAWSNTGTGRSNVTIPQGYHNGSGYVNGVGKWDAGRAQGQADKRAVTLQVRANALYGIITVQIYCDNVLVFDRNNGGGESFAIDETKYTSYTYKLSSS